MSDLAGGLITTDSTRQPLRYIPVDLTKAAWMSGAGGTDLLVLLALVTYTNSETRTCFPSISELHKRTQLALKTIRRSFVELEKAGHISVTRRDRKTSIVRILLTTTSQTTTSNKGSSDQTTTSQTTSHYSPNDSSTSPQMTGVTKEASNQGEPPRYCNKHMPYGPNGVACGGCRDARSNHDHWKANKPTPTPPRALPIVSRRQDGTFTEPACDKGHPRSDVDPKYCAEWHPIEDARPAA